MNNNQATLEKLERMSLYGMARGDYAARKLTLSPLRN